MQSQRANLTKQKPRALSMWLAVFALLAQSLIPLVTGPSVAASEMPEQTVICTANGIKTITLDDRGTISDIEIQAACPFCVLHAVALPVADCVDHEPAQTLVHTTIEPCSTADDSRPSNVWLLKPGPSRAPPLSS